MQKTIKKIIKETFNAAGIDVRKYSPRPGNLDWLKDLNIKTVLDIGANTGQFASEIAKVLPEASLHSFEPIKECFEKLNINLSHAKKFYSYNFALGDREGTVKINRSSYSPSSSILPMAETHKEFFPHTKDIAEEEIKVKTLDDFSNSHNLEKEILLKIDVQGYEDKVIAGGKKTFTTAKVVIIETSFVTLYEGQPLFDHIYSSLKSLGFQYHGSSEQKRNSRNGQIISEDSVFIRVK